MSVVSMITGWSFWNNLIKFRFKRSVIIIEGSVTFVFSNEFRLVKGFLFVFTHGWYTVYEKFRDPYVVFILRYEREFHRLLNHPLLDIFVNISPSLLQVIKFKLYSKPSYFES